jgi:hypothetical protein
MSRKFAILICFAANLAMAGPAFSDSVSDGIAAMPGGIEDVRIGGTWQKDGKSGAYRIIIDRNGGDVVTARLFVQWVAYGDAGEATVENTVEIKEFADLNLDIVDYNSESGDDGLTVYIETIGPDGNTDQQYELHIVAPDNYRFGPTTN